MKTKFFEHMIAIFLVFALAGCAGVDPTFADTQVMELGMRATQIGLKSVMAGAPSTHIITDGRLIFALWPVDQYWGGACINCGIGDPMGQFRYLTAGGRGSVMTPAGASSIVNDLVKNYGWQTISAKTLKEAQFFSTFTSQMSSLTGFLILPLGAIMPTPRPEG